MHQHGQPPSSRAEPQVRGDRRQGAKAEGARCRRDERHPREAGIRFGVAHDERTDKDHARIHTTIAVPGATTQSTGLPDDNKQGGAWIMNAGTSTAHLMTPGS